MGESEEVGIEKELESWRYTGQEQIDIQEVPNLVSPV